MDNISIARYPHAVARCYFEADAMFEGSPFALKLLEAYDHACRRASGAARDHLYDDGALEKARRWHVVANTLAAVLCCVPHTDDTEKFSCDNSVPLEDIAP